MPDLTVDNFPDPMAFRRDRVGRWGNFRPPPEPVNAVQPVAEAMRDVGGPAIRAAASPSRRSGLAARQPEHATAGAVWEGRPSDVTGTTSGEEVTRG